MLVRHTHLLSGRAWGKTKSPKSLPSPLPTHASCSDRSSFLEDPGEEHKFTLHAEPEFKLQLNKKLAINHSFPPQHPLPNNSQKIHTKKLILAQ